MDGTGLWTFKTMMSLFMYLFIYMYLLVKYFFNW